MWIKWLFCSSKNLLKSAFTNYGIYTTATLNVLWIFYTYTCVYAQTQQATATDMVWFFFLRANDVYSLRSFSTVTNTVFQKLHVKATIPLGGQISMRYICNSASTTVKYIIINRRNAEYIKGKNKIHSSNHFLLYWRKY